MASKPDKLAQSSTGSRYFWLALFFLVGLVFLLGRVAPEPISSYFATFTTIFLGIFIEAAPFLVLGALFSGFIEIFISRDILVRFVPRQPLLAGLSGAFLGFVFPVCECGVVPVTRRLYSKGLPISVGITFLLAAPVVNPVVLLSTYAAFGWGPVLIGRLVFSALVAFVVGLTFSRTPPESVVLPSTLHGRGHDHTHLPPNATLLQKIWHSLAIAGDDFLDMGRYLILGSMMAAGMQTFVPQTALLALGSGPVISVLVMMILAFVLSVCSTVDAFLALSFASTFSTGSILAFLTFGPMVDIKSAMMFLRVFHKRTVARLILLPFLLIFIIGLMVNFYF
ncbi:MAG: permease [Anaerolineales bacterium]|nr:permease [Anaerolineales bacterium]